VRKTGCSGGQILRGLREAAVNAVDAQGLEKRYGRVRALAGIAFALPSGTTTLVSGPNGAGKSTLLRILAGQTRPTAGTVRVLGEDAFGPRRAALRARIGHLGPASGLYGELSVAENLAVTARLHGAPAARIDAVIQELALEAVADRRVQTLSLGYRRRAALARVLLPAPELLLLDEPWNGLDADASARLVKRLAAVRDAGGTVVVAAHAPGGAAQAFDFALRLEAGRAALLERGDAP
jgi:heme ABC exporter ATP-binding subunit CcmA